MGTSILTAVEEKLQLRLHEISHKDYRLDSSISLFTSFVFDGCKKDRYIEQRKVKAQRLKGKWII